VSKSEVKIIKMERLESLLHVLAESRPLLIHESEKLIGTCCVLQWIVELKIIDLRIRKQHRANPRNSGDEGVKVSSSSSIFFLGGRDREN
jgi:hypothetical protein